MVVSPCTCWVAAGPLSWWAGRCAHTPDSHTLLGLVAMRLFLLTRLYSHCKQLRSGFDSRSVDVMLVVSAVVCRGL